MFNFDFLTLQAFLEENIDFLIGARLQKIQQPTRQELIFTMRNHGENKKFYINITPKFFHVCFISTENEKKRFIKIPKHPPMFCMLLRKYLKGVKITRVCQPEGERILEFYFETYSETSEKIYFCLAIELMGKHSNVILYNYGTNVIIGCAHNVGSDKSRERESIGGLPYTYPPKINNTAFTGLYDIYKTSKTSISTSPLDKGNRQDNEVCDPVSEAERSVKGEEVNDSVSYTPASPLEGEVCFQLEQKSAKVRKQGEGCYNEDNSLYPSPEFLALVPHAEILPSPSRGECRGQQILSVNEFIDNYFATFQEEEKIRLAKSKISTVVKAKLRKISSSLEKINKQSEKSNEADLYRKKGDLIMAGVNTYKNNGFLSEIEVVDWETNSSLKIKLDKTKTLIENANEYYKLYKKAKTTNIKSEEILENLQIEKEYLEQILYSIEEANDIEDLLEIEEEMTRCVDDKKRSKSHTSTPLRLHSSLPFTFHSSHFTIFVGKNNKQNDYIVSKLARDEDLWFHVHNCAGSHVLLRIESGQGVNESIILKCAKLAKEHSKAKDSSKVGVIYTKAKNLKKPPGAKLGYVTYKNEKEIIID